MTREEQMKAPEPGDGATGGAGSDSYPYTVVAVSPQKVSFMLDIQGTQQYVNRTWVYEQEEVSWPKWIEVTADEHHIVSGSGQDGSAQYEYETDPFKTPEKYILKDGIYRKATSKWDPVLKKNVVGNTTSKNNTSISVGVRRYYQDPSF